MTKELTKKQRTEGYEQYIKENTWKKFLKYKIMELGIIPLLILALWKLPLWIGHGVLNLFGVNLVTSTFFCTDLNSNLIGTPIICDGISYSQSLVWITGFGILILLIGFIAINWKFAKETVEEEAYDKYMQESK